MIFPNQIKQRKPGKLDINNDIIKTWISDMNSTRNVHIYVWDISTLNY